MSEKKEYIERSKVIDIAYWITLESGYERKMVEVDCVENMPAADVEPVVRCGKCIHGKPLKAHADGVYGTIHCALWRGEEVKNVWHKYSKHYEDYSLVDADGFCDQGEAGELSVERSGSGE